MSIDAFIYSWLYFADPRKPCRLLLKPMLYIGGARPGDLEAGRRRLLAEQRAGTGLQRVRPESRIRRQKNIVGRIV